MQVFTMNSLCLRLTTPEGRGIHGSWVIGRNVPAAVAAVFNIGRPTALRRVNVSELTLCGYFVFAVIIFVVPLSNICGRAVLDFCTKQTTTTPCASLQQIPMSGALVGGAVAILSSYLQMVRGYVACETTLGYVPGPK